MDLQLQGKVALVTGGGKGLGRASALALAREGCNIVIASRTAADLAQVEAAITSFGVQCLSVPTDLSNAPDTERLVEAAVARFGRIDILVNCAGGAAAGSIFDLSDHDWQEACDLKVMGYIRCSRLVAPIMQRQGGGRIIMISGTAGKQPSPYSICIGTFNAAINNMSRGLAEHLAAHNIGVVAISPGPTETERWDKLQEATARLKGVTVEAASESLIKGIPMGRIAQPDEVGNLVAYVASPLATYMTGVNLVFDGGAVKVI